MADDESRDRLKKAEQDAFARGQKAGEVGRHLRKHDGCLEEIKELQKTSTARLGIVEKDTYSYARFPADGRAPDRNRSQGVT